jgi:hypothetical protein
MKLLTTIFLALWIFSLPEFSAGEDDEVVPPDENVTVSIWNRHAETIQKMFGVELFDLEDNIQMRKRQILMSVDEGTIPKEDRPLIEKSWALLKEDGFRALYAAFLAALPQVAPGSGELHCHLFTEYHRSFRNDDTRFSWNLETKLEKLASFIEVTPEFRNVYSQAQIAAIRAQATRLEKRGGFLREWAQMTRAARAPFILGCAATLYVAGLGTGYFLGRIPPEKRIIERLDPLPGNTDVRPETSPSDRNEALNDAKEWGSFFDQK